MYVMPVPKYQTDAMHGEPNGEWPNICLRCINAGAGNNAPASLFSCFSTIMKAICTQCGGERSALGGNRCRTCYLENAALRHSQSDFGQVQQALLEGERLGIFKQRAPGLWFLPQFLTDAEVAGNPYLKAKRRHFRSPACKNS